MDQDLVSFVLRFVREAGEDQQARWRGVIKHVQSNSETSFTQFSEALTFMQQYVNDVVQTNFDETRKMSEEFSGMNPFLETTRLWGEFFPDYAGMMDPMDSGKVIAEQVEQATNATLSAWGLPTRTQQTSTAEALDAVTNQLVELTAKMADLEARIEEIKQDDLEQNDKEN